MRVALVIGLALMLAAPAAAQTVKGDAAAWQEIEAALVRLRQLRTYRVKMTMSGSTMTQEVQNPDRWRMIMQVGQSQIETIQVGSQVRYRSGTGPWQCPRGGAAPPPTPQRPDQMSAQEVTVSRLPDATIGGARTRAYQAVIVTQGQTVRLRYYVLADRGLPRRMEILDAAGAVTTTFDYYDYDAPITIELPACA